MHPRISNGPKPMSPARKLARPTPISLATSMPFCGGEYAKAYKINLRDNVFPAVLGRVCSRPCEAACRHGWDGLGDSVAICFSKRSASDFGGQDPVILDKWYKPSGKTVAVIGAGVAGLAAARQLALMGHDVYRLREA
jgi:NADPH-dependent glutamate synthase beta subunit-like oxidoreductase